MNLYKWKKWNMYYDLKQFNKPELLNNLKKIIPE